MTLSWGTGGTQTDVDLLKVLQRDTSRVFQRFAGKASDVAETRMVPSSGMRSDRAGSSAREAWVAHDGAGA